MYNYFLLIGKKIKLEKVNDDCDDHILTLEVQRPFKENDGTLKTDELKIFCTHWLTDYIDLSNSNVLSVKGRINIKNNSITLIAEKILCIN